VGIVSLIWKPHIPVLAPPLPLLTGLFNEHLVTSKNPAPTHVVPC
jgi:hypothetical protein